MGKYNDPPILQWEIKLKHWILVSQFPCRVFLVKQIMAQIPSLKISDLPPSGEVANLCCEGLTQKQLLVSGRLEKPHFEIQSREEKTVLHTSI